MTEKERRERGRRERDRDRDREREMGGGRETEGDYLSCKWYGNLSLRLCPHQV